MCYNISLIKGIVDLEERFEAKFVDPALYKPVYHSSAFSIPYHPVISNEGSNLIQFFQWGLIPSWIKDESAANRIRLKTFNSRAETVFVKPSFRYSIRKKRCLVLVDGFYEWRHENKKTYPYYITLTDRTAFSLAGIWDTWMNDTTGAVKNTFSIVTTTANSLLEKIHNTRKRMPVILKREDEKRWLNEDVSMDELGSMLKPFDNEDMAAHTISRLISTKSEITNTPEVMKEYVYKELSVINGYQG
jgi:putative SOS response-associated peptidase YedK